MKRTNYIRKNNSRLTVVLFLILFLFSVSASALHYHGDGFSHNDCPLCIAGNHLYTPYQDCSFGNVFLTVADMDLPLEPLLYGSVYVTHSPSRAPPA